MKVNGGRVELTDRVALVTGGAVRIGRAIVEALAAQGCGVVIHYHTSAAAARALAAVVRAAVVGAVRVMR